MFLFGAVQSGSARRSFMTGWMMGSHFGSPIGFNLCARLESEIRQKELWLRKIGTSRFLLAARLAQYRALQRRVARRRYQSGSVAGRINLRNRRLG